VAVRGEGGDETRHIHRAAVRHVLPDLGVGDVDSGRDVDRDARLLPDGLHAAVLADIEYAERDGHVAPARRHGEQRIARLVRPVQGAEVDSGEHVAVHHQRG
jgi:hypothetical protein